MITEPRIVKNLRVVVMMEHVNGPNVVTVTKMKCCEQEKKISFNFNVSIIHPRYQSVTVTPLRVLPCPSMSKPPNFGVTEDIAKC